MGCLREGFPTELMHFGMVAIEMGVLDGEGALEVIDAPALLWCEMRQARRMRAGQGGRRHTCSAEFMGGGGEGWKGVWGRAF